MDSCSSVGRMDMSVEGATSRVAHLRGKPRIKGTRIGVGPVLGYLAAGKTSADILAEFPDLTTEQIAACLDYPRELSEFEAVV